MSRCLHLTMVVFLTLAQRILVNLIHPAEDDDLSKQLMAKKPETSVNKLQ